DVARLDVVALLDVLERDLSRFLRAHRHLLLGSGTGMCSLRVARDVLSYTEDALFATPPMQMGRPELCKRAGRERCAPSPLASLVVLPRGGGSDPRGGGRDAHVLGPP